MVTSIWIYLLCEYTTQHTHTPAVNPYATHGLKLDLYLSGNVMPFPLDKTHLCWQSGSRFVYKLGIEQPYCYRHEPLFSLTITSSEERKKINHHFCITDNSFQEFVNSPCMTEIKERSCFIHVDVPGHADNDQPLPDRFVDELN